MKSRESKARPERSAASDRRLSSSWRRVVAGAAIALWLGVLGACDQGFTVASTESEGGSRPTPRVAFKTPRTSPPPEPEPTPTTELETSPEVVATPESAAPSPTAAVAATEVPPTPAATETTAPTVTVERTLVPAAGETPAPDAAPEITEEIQAWILGIISDLRAGMTAVRPYEFDAAFEVLSESNNLATVVPPQFFQEAFDSKIRSSYVVRALRSTDFTDPDQLRRPILLSEFILVHESEADAAAFVNSYRSIAVPFFGTFSDSYVQQNFRDAESRVQEDAGFGLAEDELILLGEYDLGSDATGPRPQLYIMVARRDNVNLALMVLYLESQPRMRPFGLFDRLVAKVG